MAERTVSIHSMSKTYSVTGWRIGWTIAPPDLSVGIRRVHDFLTVGAAAPLQAAAVVALDFPDAYYRDLVDGYRARRDLLLPALRTAGFRIHEPAGAYYVMTDIADLAETARTTSRSPSGSSPTRASRRSPVRRSSRDPELGRTKVRFAFPKRHETLAAAAERLARLARPRLSAAARLAASGRDPPDQVEDRPPCIDRVEPHQRIGLDRVLDDLATDARVDDRVDRARSVALERRRQRIRPAWSRT